MDIIKYTAAQWSTFNSILSDGQFGLETDTRKLKLGNGSSNWNSLSYFTSGGSEFTIASQAEAEAGTENTKIMTALRVFQSIAAWVLGDLTGLIVNTAISTTDTIKQAIGKLQGQIDYLKPVTVSFTTTIPFTHALTIVTGKTMNQNETFIAAANPVEGYGAQTWLIGNGTAYIIDFSAFDRKIGDIDFSSGVKNKITMQFIGGEYEVSILNMSAV